MFRSFMRDTLQLIKDAPVSFFGPVVYLIHHPTLGLFVIVLMILGIHFSHGTR